jgi:hypothetical protein
MSQRTDVKPDVNVPAYSVPDNTHPSHWHIANGRLRPRRLGQHPNDHEGTLFHSITNQFSGGVGRLNGHSFFKSLSGQKKQTVRIPPSLRAPHQVHFITCDSRFSFSQPPAAPSARISLFSPSEPPTQSLLFLPPRICHTKSPFKNSRHKHSSSSPTQSVTQSSPGYSRAKVSGCIFRHLLE